jgi:cytochrome b
MSKVRVWDLPVRLFHWTLALLVVAAVVCEKIGGNAMTWHFRAGYAALTLVLFRILWGLVGSRYARFSSFSYRPSAIIDYVCGGKNDRINRILGHNPLGSLSVFALLGIVLLQAGSGLFSNDDIAYDGPLMKFISKDTSDRFTWFHTEVSATLLYILVGLHVAAIAFYYLFRKQNLVRPMISGDQEVDFDAVPANDSWPLRLLGLLLFALCAGAVYWLVTR